MTVLCSKIRTRTETERVTRILEANSNAKKSEEQNLQKNKGESAIGQMTIID